VIFLDIFTAEIVTVSLCYAIMPDDTR